MQLLVVRECEIEVVLLWFANARKAGFVFLISFSTDPLQSRVRGHWTHNFLKILAEMLDVKAPVPLT
jgi:hypothetical protein